MQPRSSRSHSAPQPDLIFLCPSDLLNLGLGLHLTPGEAVLSSASARCSPHPHCCSPLAGLLPLSLTHHWRHVGNSGLPQRDQQVLGNKRFSLCLSLSPSCYATISTLVVAVPRWQRTISLHSESQIRNGTQAHSGLGFSTNLFILSYLHSST